MTISGGPGGFHRALEEVISLALADNGALALQMGWVLWWGEPCQEGTPCDLRVGHTHGTVLPVTVDLWLVGTQTPMSEMRAGSPLLSSCLCNLRQVT